jgi:hypothetical protein
LSTDASRHFRVGALPLALALLAAFHACTPGRVADALESLCATPPVAVQLSATLVIDSVTQAGPRPLEAERGRRVPVTLVFHPDPPPIAPDCPDREGTVVYEGALPLSLSQASAGSGNARWRMEGARIVIEFNPGTFDNNLGLWLPLPDGEGRWWLSTFAGEVASGRVTRP